MSEQDIHGDENGQNPHNNNQGNTDANNGVGGRAADFGDAGGKEVANDDQANREAEPNQASIFDNFYRGIKNDDAPDELTLPEYLELCRENPRAYAVPAERLRLAFGEPEVVDASQHPRYSKIYGDRKVRFFPRFNDFRGKSAVEAIERVYSLLEGAGRGSISMKKILAMLGPPGSGKSQLAERLKSLMEEEYFYALKDTDTGKILPMQENPLTVFQEENQKKQLEQEYGIPRFAFDTPASPWIVATKKDAEAKGQGHDRFSVVKVYPSEDEQFGIASSTPGSKMTQSEAELVGQVDTGMLSEGYSRNDPAAYSPSGTLNRANRGLAELIEFNKAPLEAHLPLLTATADRKFKGTEAIGFMPAEQIWVSHTNQSEYDKFIKNSDNEALVNRMITIKMGYVLEKTEESEIYAQELNKSGYGSEPIAPHTLSLAAEFAVATRLETQGLESWDEVFTKARLYDGEDLSKDSGAQDTRKGRSLKFYKDQASNDEGMSGFSTRFMLDSLEATYERNALQHNERSADPITLFQILDEQIDQSDQMSDDWKTQSKAYLEHMQSKYRKLLEQEFTAAATENFQDYGQNLFERYARMVVDWSKGENSKDDDGNLIPYESLEKKLSEIEKDGGVTTNPHEYRRQVRDFIQDYRAENNGQFPDWREFQDIRDVIEQKIAAKFEDIRPIMSAERARTDKEKREHSHFVNSMKEKGYTERMVFRAVNWYENKPAQPS